MAATCCRAGGHHDHTRGRKRRDTLVLPLTTSRPRAATARVGTIEFFPLAARSTMGPSRETLALRKQFEVQSQNFAAVLTELQQLTLQLDEQRDATQKQIDEACTASEARAQEMANRAEQMEQRAADAESQIASKEAQRAEEVCVLTERLLPFTTEMLISLTLDCFGCVNLLNYVVGRLRSLAGF